MLGTWLNDAVPIVHTGTKTETPIVNRGWGPRREAGGRP